MLPTPSVTAPALSAVPDLGAVNVQGMVPNISVPNVSSAAPNSGQVAPTVGRVLSADSSLLPGITGTTLSDIKAPSLGVVPDVGRSQVAVAGTAQGFKQDFFSLFATIAEGSGKPGTPPKTPTNHRQAVAKATPAGKTTKPALAAGTLAQPGTGGTAAPSLGGKIMVGAGAVLNVAKAGVLGIVGCIIGVAPDGWEGCGTTADGAIHWTEDDRKRQAAAAAAAGATSGQTAASSGAPNPEDPNNPRDRKSSTNSSKGGSSSESRGSTVDPNGISSWNPKTPGELKTVEKILEGPQKASPLRIEGGLKDARWPAREGWQKMERSVPDSNSKIHYNYNPRTGQVDDIKVVDQIHTAPRVIPRGRR